MYKLLFPLFLLVSVILHAQKNVLVKDSLANTPVPYVTIQNEGKSVGTTADEAGFFSLNEKEGQILVLSAVGYATKRVDAKAVSNIVLLTPIFKPLKEVVVQNFKGTEEVKIASFKRKDLDAYFGCSANATGRMVGRPYTYEDEFFKTPFLKSLKFFTKVEKDDAKFNVRLYTLNKNGEPGEFFHDENIIVAATKGKKFTEVDLSHLKLIFPKEGLFVAVEWLMLESNKYHYTATIMETSEKIKTFSYKPSFGATFSTTDSSTLSYGEGQWLKPFLTDERKHYLVLTCELTLTN